MYLLNPPHGFRLILSIAFLWAAVSHGKEIEKKGSGEPFKLLCGYSARTFVDVGIADAQVVTKLWTDMIARQKNGTAEVTIYRDLLKMEQDLKAQKVDILALVPDEFLELTSRFPLEPSFVTSSANGPYVKIVLLARKEKGIRDLKDLRNKRIVLAKGQFANIFQIWIETMLLREGTQSPQEFFSEVKEQQKPFQAAMAVFFHQADACVLSRDTLEVMTELNPQVGRELRVVGSSPELGGGAIAFRRDYPEGHKGTVRELLSMFHMDPQGKQLLTLFQLHKLVPFPPGYFDTIEALWKENRTLKAKFARKTP